MKQSNTLTNEIIQLDTMPSIAEVARIAVSGLDDPEVNVPAVKKDGDIMEINGLEIEVKDDVPLGEVLMINTDYMVQLLPHDQLLKALYWVYDFMDRAMISFFLVGDTAQAVRAKKDLFGDKITVGVRKLEWESGARQIADAFATPVKEEKYTVQYQYEGVPITLYVLEDDVTISSPDQQMYASEFFKLPNPYSKFEEVFAWVK